MQYCNMTITPLGRVFLLNNVYFLFAFVIVSQKICKFANRRKYIQNK